jgi:hypothetical protein
MDDLKDQLQRARLRYVPQDDSFEGFSRRRLHRERLRRFTTISVAMTIGLAGIAGIVLAFGGAEGGRDVTPGADLGLPSGSFYYERVDRYNMVPYRGARDVETATEELWLNPDGAGRFVADGTILNYYEPFPGAGKHQDVSFGAGGSAWVWADLPEDADAMRVALLSRGAPDGSSPVPPTPSARITIDDWRIFRAAQDLLARDQLYLAPPQRRALFLVLREIPYFDVTTDATDPLGRPATELTAVLAGDRSRWFFDEGTGQWLARVLEDGRSGDVLTAELVVRQGVVGSTDSAQPTRSFVTRPVLTKPDFVRS